MQPGIGVASDTEDICQTVIEPTLDMWTRERRPNNMVINDPKGELLVKFYVRGTVRGFEIVQFNLINAMKTDIYNPLGLAAQSAREGDFTKTAAYIENIADVFFPLDGADDPVWRARRYICKYSCNTIRRKYEVYLICTLTLFMTLKLIVF